MSSYLYAFLMTLLTFTLYLMILIRLRYC